jgi:hypothetical protein
MLERRQHRRLIIRLPMECAAADSSADGVLRANTNNISTGGLYFEVEVADAAAAPLPQSLIKVDLIVPAGQGHFPYEGRVSAAAQVLRCDPLDAVKVPRSRRVGIAAQFREPLRLDF